MTRARILFLAATAALLAAAPGGAAQPKRDACPDGLFLTDGKPFLTQSGEPAAAVIALEAGELRIEGLCDDPALAKVGAKKKFDVVKGKWETCSAFPGKVKLKAKVDAATCQSAEGSLAAKGLKPKKQKFTAVRLAPEALALLDTLSSPEVADRMVDENFPYVIHPAAEALNPEVGDLVALGPDAVPALLAAFRRPATLADETRLSLYAVALEQLGDARAVPVLADWLEENLGTASLFWAPDLVTHALKVLSGQADLDTEQFTYDIDETLDAIARVRLGEPSAAAPSRSRLARDSHLRPLNICSADVYVTGIDADMQPRIVKVDYAIYDRDIQQQLADEPPGPVRNQLQAAYDRYLSTDRTNYDASDYVPIDPAGDVSILSNCGGSVVERMLNEVAERNGFPIRLGPGTATANKARELADTFGGTATLSTLEPLLGVISHDSGSNSLHVEIPLERTGPGELLVYSKDVQGIERQHLVTTNLPITWDPVVQRYNFKPFAGIDGNVTNFFQINPARVTDIRIDTSGCDCRFRTGVDVVLDEPSTDEPDELTITVAGTATGAPVTSGSLRLNGKSPQRVDVSNGVFSTEVDLRPGRNELRLAFESPDGRRGCVERTIFGPCEFTDPDDPYDGGGLVRLSVDGGPELEWPGDTGISILGGGKKIVWFGSPPTGEPHILFELYGPRANRAGTWDVLPRPTSDNFWARDFAVGSFRSQRAVFGTSYHHWLVDGTLVVDEIETGKERQIAARFDVTAESRDDGSRKHVVGRADLCRFGIERRSGISLAD